MNKKIHFLVSSLCFVVLLTATGGSVLAAATGTAPVSGIENLLRGTKYEHLLSGDNGLKGDVPDLSYGNYFDRSSPGWGFDIQRVGNFAFAVWFTYLANGDPTWYIIAGQLNGKGVGFSGNIESFKWDPFGVPGSQATATVRGTMNFAFTGLSTADVTWTLDGEDGSASIEYLEFSSGPAYANMTGHYYNPFGSGWGYTLLTLGDVTVLTIYWYVGGQPVWAQGVSTTLGFDQVIELLLFNGPGLCPQCLDDKGGSGPTTQVLESLQTNWAPSAGPPDYAVEVGVPVVNIQRVNPVFKGGPLGPNPFEDIPLGFVPVATKAITSAYTDGFDENYGWLIGPGKGGGCLQFQYDPGILLFPPVVTGSLQPGYLLLEPNALFVLPVFIDAGCVNPLALDLFGGDPVPLGFRMGPTGDDGLAMSFEATGFLSRKFVIEKAQELGMLSAGRLTEMQESKGPGMIYGYGGTRAGLLFFGTGISFFPFPPFIAPPSSDSITLNPALGATVIIPVP